MFADSWADALRLSQESKWKALHQEAVNQYAERVLERNVDRYRQWNEIVRALKHHTIPLVLNKVKQVAELNDLSKSFVTSVQWDILHVCIESEYADVFPPGFYANQAYWYMRGHYPCGWDGEFPGGRPVIY